MRYYSEYTVKERLFGPQTIKFVVSDIYDDLFVAGGTKVDVFRMDSTKEDLDTEEGSFAIDELKFSINQASCLNDTQLKAMFFCLDAATIQVNRFCAVFFGSESISNALFVGKISDKIKGTDLKHDNVIYNNEVNPVRDYSFVCLSFDVSMLKRVSMTKPILDEQQNEITVSGTTISEGLYTLLKLNNWLDIKNLFSSKLAYKWETDSIYNVDTLPLGLLKSILDLYVSKGSQIISELLNDTFTITLLNADLGFEVCSVYYENEEYIVDPDGGIFDDVKAEIFYDRSKKLKLKINTVGDGDPVTDYSPVYIHRKMVSPELAEYTPNDNQETAEFNHSFEKFNNLAELLYNIARSFGCYIFFELTGTTSVNIEIKPRSGIVENDFTYFIGTLSSGFDTSSVLTSGANQYYGQGTPYSTDGEDAVFMETGSKEFENSDKRKIQADNIQEEKKKKNEYERSLLTTSQTLIQKYIGGRLVSRVWGLYPVHVDNGQYELLSNAVYIKTTASDTWQVTQLGTTPVWRPAGYVYVKDNDKNEEFKTLAGYQNHIMARSKAYYKTEYTLEVPFWNAFSKNLGGSGASWKNLKRGSKMRLTETVQRYISGAWQSEAIDRDYTVVSIERDLNKPRTKIKLQSVENFSFGYWDGATGELPANVPMIPFTPVEEGEKREFTATNSADSGDAAMLNSDGTVSKAVPHSANGFVIGVFLYDVSDGESAIIQVSNRVVNEDYSFTIGQKVYCRKNTSGINISQTLLDPPTNEEDKLIEMGVADSTTSFLLNIKEWVYEDVVL